MKSVALIPARGGSKRIPQKNITNLHGKPLIAWSIETAKKCDLIDEVWVSTDCEEIAEVSKKYGAAVIDRPPQLAGDTASSESALMHFAESETTSFDILVFIQATSPLTQPKHLQCGIELIKQNKCDSTLSVSEDLRFYWNSNRSPINYSLSHRPFSQEKEKWYKETGAFYITKKDALLSSKCRLSGKIEFVVVPELYSWEIDTYEDFEIVSLIMSKPI
jgi:CMP-N,N'-diacetyllegionaminic acid synthase